MYATGQPATPISCEHHQTIKVWLCSSTLFGTVLLIALDGQKRYAILSQSCRVPVWYFCIWLVFLIQIWHWVKDPDETSTLTNFLTMFTTETARSLQTRERKYCQSTLHIWHSFKGHVQDVCAKFMWMAGSNLKFPLLLLFLGTRMNICIQDNTVNIKCISHTCLMLLHVWCGLPLFSLCTWEAGHHLGPEVPELHNADKPKHSYRISFDGTLHSHTCLQL